MAQMRQSRYTAHVGATLISSRSEGGIFPKHAEVARHATVYTAPKWRRSGGSHERCCWKQSDAFHDVLILGNSGVCLSGDGPLHVTTQGHKLLKIVPRSSLVG